MQTILLLIITIILGLDFYIKHKKLVKQVYKRLFKKTGEFYIDKKGVGDKIKEDLEKLNS